VNNKKLHFKNEPARHKLLDLIGDLALIGARSRHKFSPRARAMPAMSSLQRKSASSISRKRLSRISIREKEGVLFDVNALQRILPHRYPFLLVDKIIDFS